jgi:solute carrier family 45 protein 1/2/4
MADNSKSRFGRRRPFIAVGVALCSMALILLGFTRNFASIITTWGSPTVLIFSHFPLPNSGRLLEFQNNLLTIWLAVLSIYCIDFSINAGKLYYNHVPIGRPDQGYQYKLSIVLSS